MVVLLLGSPGGRMQIVVVVFLICLVPFSLNAIAQSATITTYAGFVRPSPSMRADAFSIGFPSAVLPDGAGGFYTSNFSNIYRVSADGAVSLVAGDGSYGYNGDGGPATEAKLQGPDDLAGDSYGNLYIADTWNNRIRKVTPDGRITTVAGTGVAGYSGDGGPATAAQLSFPSGIALDAPGNLYVADTSNRRVRKISNGVITTIAGDGTSGDSGDNGPATAAKLSGPGGITTDAAGNVYFSDLWNNRIRKVTTDGMITTVAGNTTGYRFRGDGGLATSAQLWFPKGIAIDPAGNLYIADFLNNRIRKVTVVDGVIRTIAGNGKVSDSGDGGPATSAQLNSPRAVVADSANNIYIADTSNYRVRKVAPNGTISTVAGTGIGGDTGDGGPATAAQLTPQDIALDAQGNLYIASGHRVRKVAPNGTITTVAGTGTPGYSGDGGPATAAQLAYAVGVAVDTNDNLYIGDAGNGRIRKVNSEGVISTVAGNGERSDPYENTDGRPAVSVALATWSDDFGGARIAIGEDGSLYISDLFPRIRKVTPDGIIRTIATLPSISFGPQGLTVDAAGNLYVAGNGSQSIVKIPPNGAIETVAGTGIPGLGGDCGSAVTAQLQNPSGITVDRAGNLYVADGGNSRVRKIGGPTLWTAAGGGGIRMSTAGNSKAVRAGYAVVESLTSNAAVSGVAILAFRQGTTLISETAVSPVPLIQSGRIYAERNQKVNTAIAIANPSAQPAVLSFYFTDETGTFGGGTTTIDARSQLAAFLDEYPFFSKKDIWGTFTFNSSIPVAAVAFHCLTNERGEFLFSAMPVLDLSSTATSGSVFPHFTNAADWTTDIVLINSTDALQTGTIQFLDPNGKTVTQSNYQILPRLHQRLTLSEQQQGMQSGSARIIPNIGSRMPAGMALFSFQSRGITVDHVAMPAVATGSAFRIFAEHAGILAVSNVSNEVATITAEVDRLDGSSTGLRATILLPPNGQLAKFQNEISGLESLPLSFLGVVRISSSSPLAISGFSAEYNDRGDFLMVTIPAEQPSLTSRELVFPHFVDGGGYSTEFIFFNGESDSASSGTLRFFSKLGESLNPELR